jgi:hypothetical protein
VRVCARTHHTHARTWLSRSRPSSSRSPSFALMFALAASSSSRITSIEALTLSGSSQLSIATKRSPTGMPGVVCGRGSVQERAGCRVWVEAEDTEGLTESTHPPVRLRMSWKSMMQDVNVPSISAPGRRVNTQRWWAGARQVGATGCRRSRLIHGWACQRGQGVTTTSSTHQELRPRTKAAAPLAVAPLLLLQLPTRALLQRGTCCCPQAPWRGDGDAAWLLADANGLAGGVRRALW